MAPPLFGQDLRLERRARFPRGEYVFCKLPDGTIAGLPAWMTEAVACIGLDEGTAMPSAGALSELRSLLDSLASRGGASLEKIPEEAINDNTQENSGGQMNLPLCETSPMILPQDKQRELAVALADLLWNAAVVSEPSVVSEHSVVSEPSAKSTGGDQS